MHPPPRRGVCSVSPARHPQPRLWLDVPSGPSSSCPESGTGLARALGRARTQAGTHLQGAHARRLGGVRGRIGVLGMVGLPQPQQNVTYLGAHRLETRQGADSHTLVIHAAALGAGHHVYEIVHLRRGAALCREHRQVKVNTDTGAREQPAGPQPTRPSHSSRPQTHSICAPRCPLTQTLA